MQRPPYTNQLPHYSINGDGKHMKKLHNEHTVELNGKIMENESVANETHTHLFTEGESQQ